MVIVRRSHFGRFGLGLGLAVLPGILMGGCSGGSGGPSTSPPATVTTLAGTATAGATDGAASVATFNNPVNVAIDSAGNVFVADFDNNRIRKISTSGQVSTITNQANFQRPFGLAFTPDGRLFATTDADDLGNRDNTTGTLWQINLSGGAATVIARDLGRPRGIVALSNSQIVLVDLTQNDVRLINPATKVITPLAGLRGAAGFANGTGTLARFNRPYGPAVTLDGNILLADQNNNQLRLVTPAGVVTTFAGSTTPGYRDGDRSLALFNGPQDVDIDSGGNVYVTDNGNHRIRKINPNGIVSTFAGDGTQGFADGEGLQAEFYGQEGLAVRKDGTKVIVADGNNGDGSNFNRVRSLTVH
jgi:sugar lactone lactonase YvrE